MSHHQSGRRVVKTEKRVYTTKSSQDGKIVSTTTEITETYEDGSTSTTTTTVKGEAGSLETFPGDLKKELGDKGQRRRSRSSSSSSSDDENKTKKGGLLSKMKKEKKHSNHSDDSSSDEEDFQGKALQSHNYYRKKHGAGPLRLSKKMCRYSKEWARHIAAKDKMEHRTDRNYGENIYCKWSSDPKHRISGDDPVASWYAEIKDHDFTKEPSGGLTKSGHFSQVVWKDSKKMGIAKSRSRSGKIFVVANYDPAGNYVGRFLDNVLPVDGKPNAYNKAARESKHRPWKKTVAELEKEMPEGQSSDSESDEEDFAKECLKAHNDYRKKHGVAALKLNKEMSRYSKEWAKVIAKKDQMEHRSEKKYGENIFCMWSSDPKFKLEAKEAVASWYAEIKDHKFGVEPSSGLLKSGHFTQIVWKGSKELGVGKARSKTGKVMVVCNYDPAGNFIGDFAQNVPKPH